MQCRFIADWNSGAAGGNTLQVPDPDWRPDPARPLQQGHHGRGQANAAPDSQLGSPGRSSA